MSDAPGPFRFKPDEKEDKKAYQPYPRRKPSVHKYSATCIDLTSDTKAAVKSFPSSSRGTATSSSLSAMNQPGPSWSVPTTSTIVSTSVIRQPNIPRYEATSSNSNTNTCTDKVAYNPTDELLSPRSPSPELDETADEMVLSTLPRYEEIDTVKKSISPNPTTRTVTNRGIKINNVINQQKPINKYPSIRIDSESENDSESEEVTTIDNVISKQKPIIKYPSTKIETETDSESESEEVTTINNVISKQKPIIKYPSTKIESEGDSDSDSYSDSDSDSEESSYSSSDVEPMKTTREAARRQPSQVKDSSSSGQDNEDSAEQFGLFLASRLKNLTGADRLKAEQQLFECLVKTQSSMKGNNNTKNVNKNKNEEQSGNQNVSELVNLDAPEITPKREPLYEEQESSEQEQHSPQHPLESFLIRGSPPTQSLPPATFSQPSQQSITQQEQSSVQNPAMPFIQPPLPFAPQLMPHLYMPETTDPQCDCNPRFHRITALEARIAASAVCPAPWRRQQSGRRPQGGLPQGGLPQGDLSQGGLPQGDLSQGGLPQGGLPRALPQFPLGPGTAPLYDMITMASQFYSFLGNDYNNAYDFNYKY